MLTAGIAVDKATLDFDRLFSYSVPESLMGEARIGSIALVPFGRGNRLRMGIILSLDEKDNTDGLKSVVDLKGRNGSISSYSLDIIKFLKETTFCTWYEAVRAAVPYGALYKIRDGQLEEQLPGHTKKLYTADSTFDPSLLRTDKQKIMFQFLRTGEKDIDEILHAGVGKKTVLNKLVEAGRVRVVLKDRDPIAYASTEKIDSPVALTPWQEKVFKEIKDCRDNKPHLIYGVTSSGKTMVFIKLIESELRQGRSAMILVPEISLTPQMVKLLKGYFGDMVGVIHSRLSHTERLLQYNRAKEGITRVLIGTRSRVFTPLRELGLIIIDEEQEKSFKSENSPRYSAIRVASFISKKTGAKLVLASATPSIESFFLAEKEYYHLHTLTKRYADLPLPQVEVLDMTNQRQTGDAGPVSNVLLNYLSQNKARGNQSIILINRRGYSTVGICKDCKQILKCQDCSVNLVRHKGEDRLVCHYCGRTYPVATVCPVCGGEIAYYGYGTQHIEECIQQAVPDARILRMDADSTRAAWSHDEMLRAFGRGEYDILIGTQMVAKGLDFDNVTLVGVLGIDSLLCYPGYSSNEQAFDLITQVVGRAGRRIRGSKAVIQTFDPENPVIRMASKQEYTAFYKSEIAFRKLNTYPPFCTMTTVAFTGPDEGKVSKDAKTFLDIIKRTVGEYKIPITVLGPVPFEVAMVNKNYRWKLTIKCINNSRFRDFLRRSIDIYLKDKENRSSLYVNMNSLQE